MSDTIFKGLFDTDMTSVITVTDFMLCVGCALLIGIILAFSHMYRSRYTKSFVMTLALLPAVVCLLPLFSCMVVTDSVPGELWLFLLQLPPLLL